MREQFESSIFQSTPYPQQAAAADAFAFHEVVAHQGNLSVWAVRLARLTPEDKDALQALVAGSGVPNWKQNRKLLRWMEKRGVTERAFTYDTFLVTSIDPLGTRHAKRTGLVAVESETGSCDYRAHPSIFEGRD